ncbi:MAG: hypothetical protein LUC22_02370, partial [Prevotella sp.]|nr:hypothetical protein [Prevotella sp.]
MLRQIRRFVNISVRTLLVVCVLAFVSLRLSGVKTWIGERAGAALAERLGTSVRVGRVDIGMLNRVIVDDVTIYDLYGKRMLRAGRLSVKLLFSDLIQGKITIASAQVFGLKADLYKLKGGEQANFLFLADAFKTDEDSTRKPINLRINSLIIRRSEIKYNDWNAPREPDVVSPKHINVRDISAHVIVNTLSPDSADVNIRRLSMRDECGLDIRRMSLRLVAGLSGAELSDFSLVLPCSELHINSAASYNLVSGDTTRIENLKYSGTITDSSILPPELHVIKGLERLSDVPINVAADFSGTDNSLTVSRLELKQGADFALVTSADGFRDNSGMPHWTIALERLETSCEGIRNILQSAGKNVSLPAFAGSLERIALSGEASGADKDLSLSAQLATNIGDINLQIDKNGAALHGTAEADSVSIAALTGNNDFGKCTLALDVDADINGRKITTGNAQADIRGFDFKGHTYQNMTFNAGYNRDKDLNIAFTASDEFGSADVAIVVNEFTESYLTRTNLCSPDIHIPHTTYNISVRDIRPAAMGLIKSEENEAYSADISGTFACNGFDNSNGTLRVNNLMKTTADTTYCLKEFLLDIASVPEGDKKIICRSDCGDIRLTGNFRYAALPNSFTAVLAAQLPALDIKTTETGTHNKFDIYATITDTDPLCNFLNIPLRTDEPVHLIAKADDANRTISINADAKKFRYGEKEYSDVWLVANAPSDTLRVRANAKSTDDDGNTLRVNISSRAYDNRLASSLLFDSNARNHITGNLNTRVDLSEKTPEGMPVVRADVLPSDVMVADTLWSINPARITYR